MEIKRCNSQARKGLWALGKKDSPGGPGFPGKQGVGSHTSKDDSNCLLNAYCVPDSNTSPASSCFQIGRLRPGEVT